MAATSIRVPTVGAIRPCQLTQGTDFVDSAINITEFTLDLRGLGRVSRKWIKQYLQTGVVRGGWRSYPGRLAGVIFAAADLPYVRVYSNRIEFVSRSINWYDSQYNELFDTLLKHGKLMELLKPYSYHNWDERIRSRGLLAFPNSRTEAAFIQEQFHKHVLKPLGIDPAVRLAHIIEQL